MRALLKTGLCLVLGLAAVHGSTSLGLADEIEWRPVAPKMAAPKSPATIQPAAHAAATSQDGAGISLSRPLALDAPTLVRAKNEEKNDKIEQDAPRSLPLGPDPKVPPPVIATPVVSTPVGSTPVGSTPVGSTPVGSTPVGSTPVGSGALTSIPIISTQGQKPMPPADGNFPPLPSTAYPRGSMVVSSDDCNDCCVDSRCWLSRFWGNTMSGIKHWFCHDDACCDTGCRTRGPIGESCGSCGDCCGRRPALWVSGAYLYWGFNHENIPTLLAAVNPAGAIPATVTLFDGDTLNNNFRSGGRFNLGFWFPRHNDWGLDVTFMFLGRETQNFSVSGDGQTGSPTIVRPIIDTVTGLPNALVVTSPSPPFAIPQAGSFSVDTFSRLWGIDFDVRRKLCCGPRSWLDLLVGFKHLYLEEGINITDIESPLGANGTPLATFTVAESFRTVNQFNGLQLGLQGEFKFLRRWFMQGTFKVALGDMHQTVDINGTTTRVIGTTTDVAQGGVLALPTNIGHFNRDKFAVVPEAGVKIGVDLNDHWRVWVGYDFLYASTVVRPGDQIDTVVNRTQIPFSGTTLTGPARPAVLFRSTDFWTQGVSAGLEYRW